MAKLTAKQEKYVQGLVAGLSQREAYKQSYPNSEKWKDSAIDSNASTLMKNTKVLQRYNELINEHKQKALWTREQAVNDLIWLKDQSKRSIEVDDDGYVRQGTANAFIGAIQELNKLEDIYPVLNNDLNREQLEANLRKVKAEAKIMENKADKLASDEHTDELLKALIDPPIKEAIPDDTV